MRTDSWEHGGWDHVACDVSSLYLNHGELGWDLGASQAVTAQDAPSPRTEGFL